MLIDDDIVILDDGSIFEQGLLFANRSFSNKSPKIMNYDELCAMIDHHLPDDRSGDETLLITRKKKKKEGKND